MTKAVAQLKETMRDIAIEFRGLPADRQKEYLECMLVLWEQMMDKHDRIIAAGAGGRGSSTAQTDSAH